MNQEEIFEKVKKIIVEQLGVADTSVTMEASFIDDLGADSLESCKEFSLADNEFLPTYLGYFFVSLSISDYITMIYLYLIVFVFTFLSQTQYFNPIFLLFGYHYYHVSTERGTKVFVIKRGKVIRNKENLLLDNLKRINDTTYLQRKGRE